MTSKEQLLAEIRGRGYWRVTIRPVKHVVRDLSRADLEGILVRSSVSLRGWNFPHISTHEEIARSRNDISQATDWADKREFWRFTKSGQFVYIGAMSDDWPERALHEQRQYDPQNRKISFRGIVWKFSEVFEFGARLALTEAGGQEMRIEVALQGLKNRGIWTEPRFAPLRHQPPVEDRWEEVWQGPSEVLVSERERAALPMLEDLFDLFGSHVPAEVLAYHQDALRQGR